MKIANQSILARYAPDSMKVLTRFWQDDTGNIEFRGGHGDVGGELTDSLRRLINDHDRLVTAVEEQPKDVMNPARNSVISALEEYAERLDKVLESETIANPLPAENRIYDKDHDGNPCPSTVTNPEKPGLSLRTDQTMVDWCRQHSRSIDTGSVSLGDLVGGWLTGNHTQDSKRAMISTGTGGVLIPTPLSASVIDLARNQSRVMQAGALTVPMDAATLTLPRQVTDPVAKWRPELGHINRTDATFEPLVLKACSLGGLITLSMELVEDAVGLDAFLTRVMAEVMALGIDQAALTGSGLLDNKERIEPVGVINTPNIQTHTGSLNSYQVLSEAFTKIEAVNGTPNALMLSPVDYGQIDALTDTNGQPLLPPGSWSQYSHLSTNQLDANTAILADWSYLAVAVRHNIRLELSNSASVPGQDGHPAVDAFSQNAVVLRMLWRGDIGVLKPDMFVKLAFTPPVRKKAA